MFDKENIKIIYKFIYFLMISSFFLFATIGCNDQPAPQEPKIIYVQKPQPKLQTVDLKDLNLSTQHKLKLHIKIK